MKRLGTYIACMILSTGALATPVVESDLGHVSSGQLTGTEWGTQDELWFSFDLGTFSFLTIDSVGSSFDTELGLYNSDGNLIDTNDDSIASGGLCGGFFCSMLTFGSGDLAAGTYYLALSEFYTSWGDTGFNVGFSSFSGTYVINFETDNQVIAVPEPGNFAFNYETDNQVVVVPEPGTLALIGLGLAAMGMTRRKKKSD